MGVEVMSSGDVCLFFFHTCLKLILDQLMHVFARDIEGAIQGHLFDVLKV